MTDLAASPVAAPRPSSRSLACLAGAALSLAVAVLVWRLSPSHAPALALGAVAMLGTLGLALTWEERQLALGARIFAALAICVGAAAVVGAATEPLELAFSLASLGFLGGATYSLVRPAKWRLEWRPSTMLAIAAALFGALGLYAYYYVTASRDLMIADFMFYRLVSTAVATLVDSGRWSDVLVDLAMSMKQDYSWAPAIAPGLALAIGGPLSRAVYEGALLACYAVPGIWALAWLAREMARRAGMERTPSIATFVFAMAAVCAAYPHGVVIVSRGMPDIGGLALYVLALRIADRLTRVLALRPGQGRAVARLVRKLTLELALTLFAMFLFRRWYAFAVVGIGVGLAMEVSVHILRRKRWFRWRETLMAASLGSATLLALLSPVLLDWLPDPAAHDYATIYAAYRKTTEALIGVIGDWLGFGLIALALAGAAFMLTRTHGRIGRLTLVAAVVSSVLFLRVQSPYPHHVYLLAPAMTGFIGAPLIMLFARSRVAGSLALALLATATLTPAGALAPKGLFPIIGLPHAPRADMDELARMRAWVDAHARPDRKVCGLGSSYTFSGQLIDELWQLTPARTPMLKETERRSVAMTDVDTVDGPPKSEMKDCALMIVGDPVQTHVIPSYQHTVTLPAGEMLAGEGVGAHYRRDGEVFHLEKGVSAIVFERVSPLTDADMEALTSRWRALRAAEETGLRGAVGP